MPHLRRVQERRPGDIIDIGPIKEPRIAPEIDLFVSGAKFAAQDCLDVRQEPFGNGRIAFERFLRGFELGGAWKHLGANQTAATGIIAAIIFIILLP